jgi:hypothetical protein
VKLRYDIATVILLLAALPTHGTGAMGSSDLAYPETTFLMLEADLRLHHCHLSEFSLHVQQPLRAMIEPDSLAFSSPARPALLITGEQPPIAVSLCREEAEGSIRARLQASEQELAGRSVAQEKLKAFVATWLSAMKVIPRIMSGTEVLLAQQEDDRRRIMQKQSEIEVELFWSLDRARGLASHRALDADR